MEKYINEYEKIFNGGDFIRNGVIMNSDEYKIFDGSSILPLINTIINDINKKLSVTILDYGCGNGSHWDKKVLDGFKTTLTEKIGCKLQSFYRYDPGKKEYNRKPSCKFDMIICTDVLEHIPLTEIPSVLNEINSYLYDDGIIYMSINTKLSSNCFINGENMHITILEPKKWENIVKKHINKKIKVHFT